MMVDMVLCLENAVLAKFLSLFKKQKIPDLNHQKVYIKKLTFIKLILATEVSK